MRNQKNKMKMNPVSTPIAEMASLARDGATRDGDKAMKWQIKARLQNAFAAIPEPLGRKCYRYAQLLFGNRATSPQHHIELCLTLAEAIRAHGSLRGATVMEIGTGPWANMPIILWLLGAKSITEVDLYPSFQPYAIFAHMDYYRAHKRQLADALLELGGGRAAGPVSGIELETEEAS